MTVTEMMKFSLWVIGEFECSNKVSSHIAYHWHEYIQVYIYTHATYSGYCDLEHEDLSEFSDNFEEEELQCAIERSMQEVEQR